MKIQEGAMRVPKSLLGRILSISGFVVVCLTATWAASGVGCNSDSPSTDALANRAAKDPVADTALQFIDEGQHTFRHDTFGDEAFWGDTLKLHEAIAGEDNGGVGPGVSPETALAVGLKVDSESLPAILIQQIKHDQVDLTDPKT